MITISTESTKKNIDVSFTLNTSFQLCIHYCDQMIIVDSVFLKAIKLGQNIPSFISVEKKKKYYYLLIFPNNKKIVLFMFFIKCFFNNNHKVDVFADEQLKLLFKEFNYSIPCYFSKIEKKFIIIDINNIMDLDIISFKEVDIIEKNDIKFFKEVNSIFNNLSKIYSDKNILNDDEISYESICPNFNIYFPNNKKRVLSNKFKYIKISGRIQFSMDLKKFIENKKEKIYAACGPNGIGKSISSLYVQKELFLEGLSSLYINLKYYQYLSLFKWEQQMKTLITECYFLVKNEEQLKEIAEILVTKCSDFYDALIEINLYIFSNKIKALLIIDQYQKKFDPKKIILGLTNFEKLFFLSSINDKEIKENLKLKLLLDGGLIDDLIEEQIKKEPFFYHYYDSLIDKEEYIYLFQDILSDKMQELKIPKIKTKKTGKAKDETNRKGNIQKDINEVDCKRNFIKDILDKFNNIPEYYFNYFEIYDSIFDFINMEFQNVFKKLDYLYLNDMINITKMNALKSQNKLVDTKDNKEINYIQLREFVDNFEYIPLKYVNYIIKDKFNCYFYSSFPLFSHIFDEYFKYNNSINAYNANIIIGNIVGTEFENIIKIKLRIFNDLKVDGYIEVIDIVSMELANDFTMVTRKYFQNKENILVNQLNFQGKIFDFALYKSKENKLIFIQSKYTIYKKLLKHRNEFISSIKKSIGKFNNIFSLNVTEAYLVYISSVEYNIKKEKKVLEDLEEMKLNCIFYSVSENKYYYNSLDKEIEDIICHDSCKILPNVGKYIPIKKDDNENKDTDINDINSILCLGKKRNKPIDLEKIWIDFNTYAIQESSINRKILENLGELKRVYSFGENIPFNPNDQYIIMAYINEKSDLDTGKPIGLIYFDSNNNYYIIGNKNYKDYETFVKNFDLSSNCFVGSKNNK